MILNLSRTIILFFAPPLIPEGWGLPKLSTVAVANLMGRSHLSSTSFSLPLQVWRRTSIEEISWPFLKESCLRFASATGLNSIFCSWALQSIFLCAI